MTAEGSDMTCARCRRGRGFLYMIRVTAEGRAVSFICRHCNDTWTALYPLAPMYTPVPDHDVPGPPEGDVSPVGDGPMSGASPVLVP